MKLTNRLIFVLVFIFVNFLDVFTTLLAASKHSRVNELNWLYLLTSSFLITFLFKALLVSAIIAMFYYVINRIEGVGVYAVFMLMFILIIGNISAAYNNLQVYKAPKDSPGVIVEIPKQELKEIAQKEIINPQLHLYLFCIFSFWIYGLVSKKEAV